jgi:hypothetical protein
MLVTLFKNLYATEKQEVSLSLEDLAELILRTAAPARERLPLLKLAQFGDQRTANNSLRSNANMLSISGIEGDYDAGIVSVDEAVDRLKAADIKALVYTSPSHTPIKPRWRVLCPTSIELPLQQRRRLVTRLNGVLGGVLARESWTPSQAYFYGAVAADTAPRVAILSPDTVTRH